MIDCNVVAIVDEDVFNDVDDVMTGDEVISVCIMDFDDVISVVDWVDSVRSIVVEISVDCEFVVMDDVSVVSGSEVTSFTVDSDDGTVDVERSVEVPFNAVCKKTHCLHNLSSFYHITIIR